MSTNERPGSDRRGEWTEISGPLFAERWSPRSSDAAIAPLILLHGFTQTGRSWDPLLPLLDPARPLIRVDLPGHGRSGHAAADLPEIADLVVSTCGAGIYLGYSMGGRVALHIALEHATATDALALIGATPGISDDQERSERLRSDEALAASIERDGVPTFIDRWLANPMFAGLPKDRSDIEDRRRNTVHGLASSVRCAGTGTQVPLWSRLADLPMPVDIIVGANDAKFASIGRLMKEVIGRRAALHLIPDAGHTAHLERPVAVARIVNEIVLSPDRR